MSDTILIAGAGIGGLTAALCLHSRGIESRLLEAARELRPLGVGINLLPRAVGVLAELGLAEPMEHIAVENRTLRYCDQLGVTEFSEARGLGGGYRWPQYSIHRGRLQMMLLGAVVDRLGRDSVLTGHRVTGFDQDDKTVRVRTSNGEFLAAGLVGADGVQSRVRSQLHRGSDTLLWSGVRMWRGASTMSPFLDGSTMVIARDGAGVELVVYPIGGGLVNWVLMVRTAGPGVLPDTAGWNAPGLAEDVLAHLRNWNLGWLDIPTLIAGTEQIFEYPMADKEPISRWSSGRVSLLGDAAHPMYPIGANGGTQAILDAHALASSLDGDVRHGLSRYEVARRAATAEIIAANRQMHHAGAAADLAAVTARYRTVTGADDDLLSAP